MRDREIYHQVRKVPLKLTKISENNILSHNTPRKNKKNKNFRKKIKKILEKGRVCVKMTHRGGGGMVVFYFAL